MQLKNERIGKQTGHNSVANQNETRLVLESTVEFWGPTAELKDVL